LEERHVCAYVNVARMPDGRKNPLP
jgi:hypothetical protein